jgi:protein-S-isoprenylcysteine O-methyltransferase Ste14
MYLGAFVAVAGALLLYRTWTMLLIVAHLPIFAVRAQREEIVLAAEFGAAWETYRQQVPAWLPRSGRLITNSQ